MADQRAITRRLTDARRSAFVADPSGVVVPGAAANRGVVRRSIPRSDPSNDERKGELQCRSWPGASRGPAANNPRPPAACPHRDTTVALRAAFRGGTSLDIGGVPPPDCKKCPSFSMGWSRSRRDVVARSLAPFAGTLRPWPVGCRPSGQLRGGLAVPWPARSLRALHAPVGGLLRGWQVPGGPGAAPRLRHLPPVPRSRAASSRVLAGRAYSALRRSSGPKA